LVTAFGQKIIQQAGGTGSPGVRYGFEYKNGDAGVSRYSTEERGIIMGLGLVRINYRELQARYYQNLAFTTKLIVGLECNVAELEADLKLANDNTRHLLRKLRKNLPALAAVVGMDEKAEKAFNDLLSEISNGT
jgi:hypothetical protein